MIINNEKSEGRMRIENINDLALVLEEEIVKALNKLSKHIPRENWGQREIEDNAYWMGRRDLAKQLMDCIGHECWFKIRI